MRANGSRPAQCWGSSWASKTHSQPRTSKPDRQPHRLRQSFRSAPSCHRSHRPLRDQGRGWVRGRRAADEARRRGAAGWSVAACQRRTSARSPTSSSRSSVPSASRSALRPALASHSAHAPQRARRSTPTNLLACLVLHLSDYDVIRRRRSTLCHSPLVRLRILCLESPTTQSF